MAKQNGVINGSHDESWQEAEALKSRLMMLPDKAFDRELKKLPPVAVQELLAFTVETDAQPKRPRVRKDAEAEPVPKPERTVASVRASLLKKYFDSLSERKHDSELKKLSLDDLHLLVWATAYENAQKNRKRR